MANDYIDGIKIKDTGVVYDIQDADAQEKLQNVYTITETNALLDTKQNVIDAGHKLNADYVDDTNATHKFATSAQLTQIATNTTNIGTLTTDSGASIDLVLNPTDFKLYAVLKNKAGTTVSTSTVVDLPMESVVVGGSYDSVNKKIILTLQNGNTIEIPVGDLVAGLQTEITSENMLSSDLVDDTNHTHKFVTASEKAQITTNQNNITDLTTNKVDKTTTVNGHALSGNVTVTKSDVSLGNVTNDAQVKGLASGTTNGHLLAFGSDGYTIQDSGIVMGDVTFTITDGTWDEE